jgi:hypothetical protein
LPTTLDTGVMQDRIGRPSRCTVHAPHSATPQANLVPVSPTTSRSTHKRGMSSGTSSSCSRPLITNFGIASPIGNGGCATDQFDTKFNDGSTLGRCPRTTYPETRPGTCRHRQFRVLGNRAVAVESHDPVVLHGCIVRINQGKRQLGEGASRLVAWTCSRGCEHDRPAGKDHRRWVRLPQLRLQHREFQSAGPWRLMTLAVRRAAFGIVMAPSNYFL